MFYAAEDGEVYRVPVAGSGIDRSRGGKVATLMLGDHPIAHQVHRLAMSRSWAAEFSPDRHLWLAGPPRRLGTSGRQLEGMAPSESTRGRLVISPQPDLEFEVEQGIDKLGWSPEAVFAGLSLRRRAIVASASAASEPDVVPGERSVRHGMRGDW